MFVDFSALADRQWDYIVVGSGPAGLYIANRLKKFSSVLVIERGGIDDPNDVGDESYEIDITGQPYGKYGSRLSAFGGSSNHWNGQSHPLSPQIFQQRFRNSGWPVSFQDYAVHLAKSTDFLRLNRFVSEKDFQPVTPSYDGAENLVRDEFQLSRPILRLGDDATIGQFRDDEFVDILLKTKVTDISLNDANDRVEYLELLHGDQKKTISVKSVILACGGVENARLLLWSARKYSRGNPLAGGPNELSGKYFMEHPHIKPLDVYFDRNVRLDNTIWHEHAGRFVNYAWRPPEKLFEDHEIPRFGVFFWNLKQTEFDGDEFERSDDLFMIDKVKYDRSQPTFTFEQTPYAASQVRLSGRRDRHGAAIAELHWQISPEDLAAYRSSALLFGSILSQFGNARVRLRNGFEAEDWSGVPMRGGPHHMGTTKMSHRARDGVVDTDCKVFGLANLFIAGSSVFPRADYVNPTLNLISFAARLSEHLLVNHAMPRDRFSFGADAIDNILLTHGWSYPEQEGVWTDSALSGIRFEKPVTTGRIQFFGRAFGRAQVQVLIDGNECYRGSVAALVSRIIDLNREVPINQIDFSFRRLTSPKEAGSGEDSRKLGLFLKQIRVD